MSMQNKDWLCHILASITIVLWASSYSPTALSLLRYMFGAAALVIFGCIKRIGLPKLRDVPKFFLAGALGITVYMVAYNIGAQTLSGTTCSVVLAMNPVFTAILSHFLFREKIRFLGWVSIAIGFGGILILTLWNGALSINIGILWVLASALLFSGYNITQRQYSKDYTPLSTAIYSIVAGAIMLFVFLPELLPQLQAAPLEHTMIAAYLGLSAKETVGRGAGLNEEGLARKRRVIEQQDHNCIQLYVCHAPGFHGAESAHRGNLAGYLHLCGRRRHHSQPDTVQCIQ